VRTHTHANTHTHKHIHTLTRTHTHTKTHKDTHTHTNTHAHTYQSKQELELLEADVSWKPERPPNSKSMGGGDSMGDSGSWNTYRGPSQF